MAKKKQAASPADGRKTIAANRRARYDYDILDVYEAGIALVGSEVKSLREGKVQLKDAYARVERGEMLLLGVHISPYTFAVGFGSHVPERARKLLLHKVEIEELNIKINHDHLTVIPMEMYFLGSRVKVELGLAKGRKEHDKRHAIADRDAKRDIAKAMSARLRHR